MFYPYSLGFPWSPNACFPLRHLLLTMKSWHPWDWTGMASSHTLCFLHSHNQLGPWKLIHTIQLFVFHNKYICETVLYKYISEANKTKTFFKILLTCTRYHYQFKMIRRFMVLKLGKINAPLFFCLQESMHQWDRSHLRLTEFSHVSQLCRMGRDGWCWKGRAMAKRKS